MCDAHVWRRGKQGCRGARSRDDAHAVEENRKETKSNELCTSSETEVGVGYAWVRWRKVEIF